MSKNKTMHDSAVSPKMKAFKIKNFEAIFALANQKNEISIVRNGVTCNVSISEKQIFKVKFGGFNNKFNKNTLYGHVIVKTFKNTINGCSVKHGC
jgi:hypothetical protein